VAVQNAHLFQDTLERARREQTVLELSSEIRQHEDVEGMLRTAVEEMRSALGASKSRIKLFEQPIRSEQDDQETKQEERNIKGPQSEPELDAEDDQ
jgi:hypothetical protein